MVDRRIALRDSTPADRFQYTPKQLDIVNSRLPGYFKSTGIPFNHETARAVRAILGVDAVDRAMLEAGIDRMHPSLDIRPLLRRGLELRAVVRDTAAAGLEGIEAALRRDPALVVGPYAYKVDTAQAAIAQIKQFASTPNIKEAEEIAALYTQRSHALPQLAQVALGTVPHEQFPQATLENFPSPEDQAKLVRNMIAAYIFRGGLAPVITIEELRRFTEEGKDIQLLLQESDVLSSIISLLPEESTVPKSVYEQYLTDLAIQVAAAFLKFRAREFHSSRGVHGQAVFERDHIYGAFNDTLLLLHPALEEEPIIVNPDRAGESDYSLWGKDLSVVVNGQRIPVVNALFRAERLANVRGYDTSRFENAQRAWNKYFKSSSFEAGQIARLSQQITDLERRREETSAGAPLPTHARVFAQAWERSSHDERKKAEHAFRDNRDRIIAAKRQRQQMDEYLATVADLPEGASADILPMPEVIGTKYFHSEKARRTQAASLAKQTKEKLQTLVREDAFFRGEVPEQATDRQLVDQPLDVLDRMTVAIQERITAFQDPQLPLPDVAANYTYQDMLAYIGNYSEKLRERTSARRGRSSIAGDTTRLSQLEQLRKDLGRMRKDGASDDEIARVFYIHALRNRLGIMKLARQAEERRVFSESPVEVPDVIRSDEVASWIKGIEIETIPQNRYTTEELRILFPALRDFWTEASKRQRVQWPTRIPDKATFKAWVKQGRDAAEEIVLRYQEDKKIDLNTYLDARDIVTTLVTLGKIIDHPLFPIDIAEGLRSFEFWYSFGLRYRLIKALTEIEESSDVYNRADVNFDEVARRVYLKYLDRRIIAATKEREQMQANPPARTRLVEEMRRLNLVRPEPDDSQTEQK